MLVEKYAPGHDYRLLVVGERSWRPPAANRPRSSATACTRSPQLVDIVNPDPRRGEHHATSLSKIKLDAVALAVLAEQGLYARVGAAGRADRADPPQCQPEHRRHGHRRDRARASGGGGPRDRRRHGRSAWTSPASTSWPRTSAGRWKSRAASSSRSTRPPGCACTWSRRPASRGRWARRSST